MKNKERMEQLLKEIAYHDNLYFNLDMQEISDIAYDCLVNELKDLEKRFPELAKEKSPTKKVSGETSNDLPRIQHKYPLLSLDKCKNMDLNRMEEFLNLWETFKTDSFMVQHKEDGLSLGLTYKKGKLTSVVTRGDGEYGEDVTKNLLDVPSIPLELTGDLKEADEVIIRGEAIIKTDDFNRLNKENIYKSPRNLVSGSIRTKDVSVAKKRFVIFHAYNIETYKEQGIETTLDMFELLHENGFETPETKVFENNKEGKKQLLTFLSNFTEEFRATIDHLIDGLVVLPTNCLERDLIGSTNHHPKWAIAYKFESEVVKTILEDVQWSIGKTGMLTPNAVLKPVMISNATVQRASLANINNIRKRDLRIGDVVLLARSNDVIPQVIASIASERLKKAVEIVLPENCPFCEEQITVIQTKNGREILDVPYCLNNSCCAKTSKVLTFFAGKSSMDIKGLSIKTVELFVDNGYLTDIPSIYKLLFFKNELLSLEGIGLKKVDTILKSIGESKTRGLEKVLQGLGIEGLGKDLSATLSNHFKSFDKLLDKFEQDPVSFEEELRTLKNIGDVSVDMITNVLVSEQYVNMLKELKELGVSLEDINEETDIDGDLQNLTFVVTGKTKTPRKQLEKEIVQRGGKVTSAVTKNTDYLIFGGENKTSSKYKKALDLNIKIVDETFLE